LPCSFATSHGNDSFAVIDIAVRSLPCI
jgi:hypothetical protein